MLMHIINNLIGWETIQVGICIDGWIAAELGYLLFLSKQLRIEKYID